MKLLLFTVFFAPLLLQSQVVLTRSTHEPTANDFVVYFAMLDSGGVLARQVGTGQLWDFSSISYKGQVIAETYKVPSSTLYYDFSAGVHQFKSQSSPDGWAYAGYEPSTKDYTTYTNPRTLIAWPFSLGSQVIDTYYADGVLNPGGGLYSSDEADGTCTVTASGTGTAIIPGGTTYNNVLQVQTLSAETHTFKVVSSGSSSFYSLREIRYEYYIATQKFPILAMQQTVTFNRQKPNQEFIEPATAKIFKNGGNAGNVGIAKNSDLEKTKIFPTPCGDLLYVAFSDDTPRTIRLVDMAGKVLFTDSTSENDSHYSIPTAFLQPAIYILEIDQRGVTERQKFVKGSY